MCTYWKVLSLSHINLFAILIIFLHWLFGFLLWNYDSKIFFLASFRKSNTINWIANKNVIICYVIILYLSTLKLICRYVLLSRDGQNLCRISLLFVVVKLFAISVSYQSFSSLLVKLLSISMTKKKHMLQYYLWGSTLMTSRRVKVLFMITRGYIRRASLNPLVNITCDAGFYVFIFFTWVTCTLWYMCDLCPWQESSKLHQLIYSPTYYVSLNMSIKFVDTGGVICESVSL